MACHPTLPLLVCSDGYTFTLLQLSCKHGLLETVKSLVTHSRKELEIEEGESLPHHDGTRLSDSQALGDSSHLDFRDFVVSLDVGHDESQYRRTSLEQSTPSLGGVDEGFLDRYLRNLDAGQINFALDGSSRASFDASGSVVSRRSDHGLRLALSYLQAATGLLLSCDPLVPCRGALPSSRSPDLEQVEANKLELHHLTTILVSTISKVLSQASLLSAFSSNSVYPEMVALSHDFISSLLKLITLDVISQAHTRLSLSLANVVFISFISGLSERHCVFERLDKDKHTLMYLLEYTDTVGRGMHDFSSLLEDMVHILLSTYDVHPSIFGEVSKTSSHASSPSSNCMLYLSSALKASLKLITSLWKDMKICRRLSSSARYSPNKHHDLHLSRESMVRNLSNSTKNASSTLRALQNYVCLLLQSYTHQFSSRKLHVTSRSDGKPITYSPTMSNSRKKFFDSLLRYDLRTAMEVVCKCLKEHVEEEEIEEREKAGGNRMVISPFLQLTDIFSCSSMWNQGSLTTSKHVIAESDADRLLVGALGDLMASYFTNQKLLVSLSSSEPCSPSRQVELSRSKLVQGLKDGDVSEFWTVERALSFFLLADKWEKACNFVVELGDWRKAFVLSSIHSLHHKLLLSDAMNSEPTSNSYFFDFSHNLACSHILKVVGSIFKKQDRVKFWKRDLDRSESRESSISLRAGENFLHESFRVCVMMKMENVLLSIANHCLSEMVEACASVSTRVPAGFYLPAPPLYCTQPSITEEVRH